MHMLVGACCCHTLLSTHMCNAVQLACSCLCLNLNLKCPKKTHTSASAAAGGSLLFIVMASFCVQSEFYVLLPAVLTCCSSAGTTVLMAA